MTAAVGLGLAYLGFVVGFWVRVLVDRDYRRAVHATWRRTRAIVRGY